MTNILFNSKVAEMHAELIDFNSTLQQKLSEKEAVIDQLKNELEMLRGPVPSHDLGGNNCVQAWIPSTFLTGKKFFSKGGFDTNS